MQKHVVAHTALRRQICITLAITLVAVGALYLFFLASTTMYIAERKSIETDIRNAHSRLADLEAEFFAQHNGIDLAFAREHGFVEATEVAFETRTPASESFAFRVE